MTAINVKRKSIMVCPHCLAAIKSRGEKPLLLDIHYIDSGYCDWCHDDNNDCLYEIKAR